VEAIFAVRQLGNSIKIGDFENEEKFLSLLVAMFLMAPITAHAIDDCIMMKNGDMMMQDGSMIIGGSMMQGGMMMKK